MYQPHAKYRSIDLLIIEKRSHIEQRDRCLRRGVHVAPRSIREDDHTMDSKEVLYFFFFILSIYSTDETVAWVPLARDSYLRYINTTFQILLFRGWSCKRCPLFFRSLPFSQLGNVSPERPNICVVCVKNSTTSPSKQPTALDTRVNNEVQISWMRRMMLPLSARDESGHCTSLAAPAPPPTCNCSWDGVSGLLQLCGWLYGGRGLQVLRTPGEGGSGT